MKEELRSQLLEQALRNGTRAAGPADGGLAVLATRGLDALDNYYTQFLPALVNCAAIPLLLGARILFADWISAVVIVLTVPLVPLFMVLIGRYTEERVREAQSALARLSGHMLELAKGLPVLVGLGRAAAQRKALEDMSEEYRSRTMGTLRTAFLSALALELIATISVAVVAVFIGVRLVHGDMALEAGLLALILAPDCYLPLRELGTAHHASDDGRAALAETTAVLADPGAAPLRPAPRLRALPGCRRRIRRWPARPARRHRRRTDRPLRRTGGRRRRAAELHRRRRPDHGPRRAQRRRQEHGARRPRRDHRDGRAEPVVYRTRSADSRRRSSPGCRSIPSWWPPRCWRRSGCISAFPPLGPTPPRPDSRRRPAGTPWRPRGTAGDAAARRCLAAVAAEHLAAKHPAELSPGELRRVALARGLARIEAGAGVLLLDEPTAHLDRESATVVNRALAGLRGQVTVLLVAHDRQTRELADTLVAVAPDGGGHQA